MITPETLQAIQAGREFRRVNEAAQWRSLPDGGNPYLDVMADYELKPLAPVFEHWHMLPGIERNWIAMDSCGMWRSFTSEPKLWEHGGIWNAISNESSYVIPARILPTFSGDWRESKIQRPAPSVVTT